MRFTTRIGWRGGVFSDSFSLHLFVFVFHLKVTCFRCVFGVFFERGKAITAVYQRQMRRYTFIICISRRALFQFGTISADKLLLYGGAVGSGS